MVSDIVAAPFEDQEILPVLARVFHTIHDSADQVDPEAAAAFGGARRGSFRVERIEGRRPIPDLQAHGIAREGQPQPPASASRGPVPVMDDVRDDLFQGEVEVMKGLGTDAL
jgi:hypothetical protein